ncbi:MAG: diacylglycerol/polyprenol kinase family protein [Candidatus Aenigmatarchaeota archaeon]
MTSRIGELLRKLVHISGVIAVPILYVFGSTNTAIIFFVLAAGLYLYANMRAKTPVGRFLAGFRKLLDFLERDSQPRYRGAIYFFESIGFIALLFPEKIAAISIIVLSVGDGISTLAGRALGHVRIFYNKSKSVEGSVSGFIASSVVCALITNIPVAIFASFVGMVVESLDIDVNDNATIPFAVAIIIYVLSFAGLVRI